MINSASDCYIILGIGDDFQPEVVGDFTEDHVASFLKVLRPSLQLSTADIAKIYNVRLLSCCLRSRKPVTSPTACLFTHLYACTAWWW